MVLLVTACTLTLIEADVIAIKNNTDITVTAKINQGRLPCESRHSSCQVFMIQPHATVVYDIPFYYYFRTNFQVFVREDDKPLYELSMKPWYPSKNVPRNATVIYPQDFELKG